MAAPTRRRGTLAAFSLGSAPPPGGGAAAAAPAVAPRAAPPKPRPPQLLPAAPPGHEGLEVCSAGRAKGFGLFATKHVQPGEILYREVPEIFHQYHYSALVAPACLNCGAFAGGLRDAVGWAVKGCGRSVDEWPDLASSGALDDPALQLGSWLPCPRGCGAIFCSGRCRDMQLTAGHHRVLCGELPDSSRTAWAAFQEHARRHHETFALAALAVAQAIVDARRLECSLELAAVRFTRYCARPWHQMLPRGARDRLVWAHRRLERLEASRALLVEVLAHRGPDVSRLLARDFWASLVGSLDICTKGMHYPHPLSARLERAPEALTLGARSDLRGICLLWDKAQEAEWDRDVPNSPSESGSEDEGGAARETTNLCLRRDRAEGLPWLPGFDGLGLYPGVAVSNHSCAPNAEVRLGGEGAADRGIRVVALRGIREDEEVQISYLDGAAEGASLAERRAQLLRDHGFECVCARCEAEAQLELAGESEDGGGGDLGSTFLTEAPQPRRREFRLRGAPAPPGSLRLRARLRSAGFGRVPPFAASAVRRLGGEEEYIASLGAPEQRCSRAGAGAGCSEAALAAARGA